MTKNLNIFTCLYHVFVFHQGKLHDFQNDYQKQIQPCTERYESLFFLKLNTMTPNEMFITKSSML